MPVKVFHKQTFLYWLLSIIGIALVIWAIPARGAKQSVTNQLLAKQKVLTRAEANNVSTFFTVFGESVAVMAQLKSIEARNADAQHNLDAFVEQWRESNLNGGIITTNKNGVVDIHSSVTGIVDLGEDLSDREYFVWAQDAQKGEYFVGKPIISRLGATEGELIVAVASPIFNGDEFDGAIAASVKLVPLMQRYLDLMKVADDSQVFLLDEGGELIYTSSDKYSYGANVFDYFAKYPFKGSEVLVEKTKTALAESKEGSLRTSFIDPEDASVKNYLVSYSPVLVGGKKWMLVITSPANEVWELTVPIYTRLAFLGIFVSLTVLAFGIFVRKEVEAVTPQNKL